METVSVHLDNDSGEEAAEVGETLGARREVAERCKPERCETDADVNSCTAAAPWPEKRL